MIKSASRIRLAAGMTLIASVAVLSGCGPAPYSRTSTTEQTTTTTPAPVVSTETVTTQQNFHAR